MIRASKTERLYPKDDPPAAPKPPEPAERPRKSLPEEYSNRYAEMLAAIGAGCHHHPSSERRATREGADRAIRHPRRYSGCPA